MMSHPDVRLVNIFLSTTRVSLVQNKFVFCQLRVHYIGDPDITKTYLGIQAAVTTNGRNARPARFAQAVHAIREHLPQMHARRHSSTTSHV